MSERKEGWYWVKFDSDNWDAGYWAADHALWLIQNPYGLDYKESDMREIGPRIPTPDEIEGWQLVPVEADSSMVRAGMTRGAAFGFGAHYAAALRAAPRFGEEK